ARLHGVRHVGRRVDPDTVDPEVDAETRDLEHRSPISPLVHRFACFPAKPRDTMGGVTADIRLAPRFGRVLTIAVGVVAAVALVGASDQGPESVARTIAPIALLVVATWAAF